MGVAISRGFYYIVENHSGREALNWLLEVVYQQLSIARYNQNCIYTENRLYWIWGAALFNLWSNKCPGPEQFDGGCCKISHGD